MVNYKFLKGGLSLIGIWLCVAVCILYTPSCRPKDNHYEIHGTIRNLPKEVKKVYLELILVQTTTTIDTASVDKDGSYHFNGFLHELSLCRLRFSDNGFRYLVLKNGDDITLDMDFNSGDYSFKGSPASSSLNVFQDSLVKNRLIYETMMKQLTKMDTDDSMGKMQYKKLDAYLKNKKKAFLDYTMHYADTASNVICSIFAYAMNTPPKAEYYDYLKKYSDNLSAKYNHLELARQFSNALKETLRVTELNNIIKPGNIAPDINLPDKNGQMRSLSSLRGKYVLLDFWASWCKPCRVENPNIVNAWNKFKHKGFTIYSVSLDTRKEDWQMAIEADKMGWENHVCDFKEWFTSAHDAYGFTAIPFNVLIDPNGRIIATELKQEALIEKLTQVYQQ